MRTIGVILRYEYARHVRRRAFLLTTLGLPLLIVGFITAIELVTRSQNEQRLGLVDRSGLVGTVNLADLNLRDAIPLAQFADEAAARRALDAHAIDAYMLVPPAYLATGQAQVVSWRSLSDDAADELRAVLRHGLIGQAPPEQRARLDQPADWVVRTLDGQRTYGMDDRFLLFLLPYSFALLFTITAFTTSGHLLQALTEEKEDRVMELLATSATPEQMMTGKILGVSAVSLTQIGIWVGLGLAALVVLGVPAWIAGARIPWLIVGLALLYYLLGYLLIAACYIMVGAAAPTTQEAQLLAAPISLLAAAPFVLLVTILEHPNGPLATIFSLIPFSAPIAMLLRLPLADVPAWQLVISVLLLALATMGAMMLSARVLRRGMLRYGQRLRLRELWAAPHGG
ncbi:MAG TPA: ABC transporter permease [Herpetosiphonaceae bacterium]